MTAAEYLEQLSGKLNVLPESERRDALEYYEVYFSDAENEAEAISRLGSPGEVAAIILANYVSSDTQSDTIVTRLEDRGSTKKSASSGIFSEMKTAWVIILAIFALPVGLPIIIAVAAVAFALFIALCSVVFAFSVAGLAMLLSGIAGFFIFPFIIAHSFGFAMIMIGTGLLSLGIGILFVKLSFFLMRGFPRISRYVGKEIRRVGNGKQ